MPEPSLSPDDAALLAARIAAGACWQAISANMRGMPVRTLKRHAARLRLAHDAPGAWPQVIDPDDEADGVARPMADPLLDALERAHHPCEVRDVPVRRGMPRRVTGAAPMSLTGSPALDSVER